MTKNTALLFTLVFTLLATACGADSSKSERLVPTEDTSRFYLAIEHTSRDFGFETETATESGLTLAKPKLGSIALENTAGSIKVVARPVGDTPEEMQKNRIELNAFFERLLENSKREALAKTKFYRR